MGVFQKSFFQKRPYFPGPRSGHKQVINVKNYLSRRIGITFTHHLIYHQIIMVLNQIILWMKNGVSNYK